MHHVPSVMCMINECCIPARLVRSSSSAALVLVESHVERSCYGCGLVTFVADAGMSEEYYPPVCCSPNPGAPGFYSRAACEYEREGIGNRSRWKERCKPARHSMSRIFAGKYLPESTLYKDVNMLMRTAGSVLPKVNHQLQTSVGLSVKSFGSALCFCLGGTICNDELRMDDSAG